MWWRPPDWFAWAAIAIAAAMANTSGFRAIDTFMVVLLAVFYATRVGLALDNESIHDPDADGVGHPVSHPSALVQLNYTTAPGEGLPVDSDGTLSRTCLSRT
ncbi:hypothetical protein D3C84_850920 [compost metagenome]